eukprot:gb/GFBE01050559.1/.p1 GENE.gb/GFBE01050559.1/~~gb/GFBE01050559.1/.p1  ORF type:complete len:126 (+),score=33.60 gb/GFBE01050559.1/:1-378(+)
MADVGEDTDAKASGDSKPSASKEEAVQAKNSKEIKTANLADDEAEVISQYQAKAKARRRLRQKRMQYQFLFKAGAFLVMLIVVLITKKFQEWYKPEGSSSTSKGSSPQVQSATSAPQTDAKGGEL